MHYQIELFPCRIGSPEDESSAQVAVDVYELNADGLRGRLVDSCGPWATVDDAKAEMSAWAAKKWHALTFFGEP